MLLNDKIFILETPYIKIEEKSKESYPPYKFEIKSIKDKTFNSNLILIFEYFVCELNKDS